MLRVAAIQHPPVFLDLQRSLDRAETLIAEAASAGSQLIVFPETWLPGYPIWLDLAPEAALWDHAGAKELYGILHANALAVSTAEYNRLRSEASRANTIVVMGAHEKVGGTLFNTTFYFLPDGSVEHHRKLIPTHSERLIWGRGDGSTLPVVDTPYGRLGGLICWEHWMPLARAAMHARGETIHVAQWPWVKDMHQVASRHYAFEGRCFVVAAGAVLSRSQALSDVSVGRGSAVLDLLGNMIGDDPYLLRGGSAIIAPNGQYVVPPTYDVEQIVIADIDPNVAIGEYMTLDTNGHYSRPDVFRLIVDYRAKHSVTFGVSPDEDLATRADDDNLSN